MSTATITARFSGGRGFRIENSTCTRGHDPDPQFDFISSYAAAFNGDLSNALGQIRTYARSGAGDSFAPADPISRMARGTIEARTNAATRFTIINAAAGRKFVIVGADIAYNSNAVPIRGAISVIRELTTDGRSIAHYDLGIPGMIHPPLAATWYEAVVGTYDFYRMVWQEARCVVRHERPPRSAA